MPTESVLDHVDEKHVDEKPVGEKPVGEHPVGEKQVGEQPIGAPEKGGAEYDRSKLLDRLVELRQVFVRKLMPSKDPELSGILQNVTIHQMEVLHLLDRAPLTMSDLARRMNVSESAATSLVDRLVRQNLVERFADPADRRVVRVGLSADARTMASALSRRRRAASAAVFGVLDDRQLCTLVNLLELVAGEAGEMDSTCPPRAGGGADR